MFILLCTTDSTFTDSRRPQQCLPFQSCRWANWSTRSLLNLGTVSPKAGIRRHLPVLPGAAFIHLECHSSLSIHRCISAYRTQSESIEEHKGHSFLWTERFLKTLTKLGFHQITFSLRLPYFLKHFFSFSSSLSGLTPRAHRHTWTAGLCRWQTSSSQHNTVWQFLCPSCLRDRCFGEHL